MFLSDIFSYLRYNSCFLLTFNLKIYYAYFFIFSSATSIFICLLFIFFSLFTIFHIILPHLISSIQLLLLTVCLYANNPRNMHLFHKYIGLILISDLKKIHLRIKFCCYKLVYLFQIFAHDTIIPHNIFYFY